MQTSYKKRMKIEYDELCERIEKLCKILSDWCAGNLDFEPTCPLYLLEKQLEAMQEYRNILEERNLFEKVW